MKNDRHRWAGCVQVFRQLAVRNRPRRDGDRCISGDEIAEVVGPAAALLTAGAPRSIFQRLGIATCMQIVNGGGRITVLETRRPPDFGRSEVCVRRRGANHRAGLFDAGDQDNHIRLAGGVKAPSSDAMHVQPVIR